VRWVYRRFRAFPSHGLQHCSSSHSARRGMPNVQLTCKTLKMKIHGAKYIAPVIPGLLLVFCLGGQLPITRSAVGKQSFLRY
jgi:hypothetical protein